jgi:hypothetical protein
MNYGILAATIMFVFFMVQTLRASKYRAEVKRLRRRLKRFGHSEI